MIKDETPANLAKTLFDACVSKDVDVIAQLTHPTVMQSFKERQGRAFRGQSGYPVEYFGQKVRGNPILRFFRKSKLRKSLNRFGVKSLQEFENLSAEEVFKKAFKMSLNFLQPVSFGKSIGEVAGAQDEIHVVIDSRAAQFGLATKLFPRKGGAGTVEVMTFWRAEGKWKSLMNGGLPFDPNQVYPF